VTREGHGAAVGGTTCDNLPLAPMTAIGSRAIALISERKKNLKVEGAVIATLAVGTGAVGYGIRQSE